MKTVSVSMLRDQTTSVINSAAAGQATIITRHQRPVAVVLPYHESCLDAVNSVVQTVNEARRRLSMIEIDDSEDSPC